MKTPNTQHALTGSIVGILLCAILLVGASYAWFTSGTTSAVGTVTNSEFNVLMQYSESFDGGYSNIDSDTNVFSSDDLSPNGHILRYIKISNLSSDTAVTAALKMLKTNEASSDALASSLNVYAGVVTEAVTFDTWKNNDNSKGTLNNLPADGTLLGSDITVGRNTSVVVAVALELPSTGSTALSGASLSFTMQISATQTQNVDSATISYDGTSVGSTIEVSPTVTTIGYTIPANTTFTYSDGTTAVTEGNITLKAEKTLATNGSASYDITLKNATGSIKPDKAITVKLYIGKDFSSVSVTHSGTAMNESEYSYDSSTGYLTITTSSFSPFGITWTEPVAEVGGVKYPTLQEAVNAAGKGDTVTLLRPASGKGVIAYADDDFTLDFGGMSYLVTSGVESDGGGLCGLLVLNGASVTLEGGSLSTACAKTLVRSCGALTVKDMTLTGVDSAVCDRVLDACAGTLAVTGDTSLRARTGSDALRVYAWTSGGYTAGPQVTVSTTGRVEGNVTVARDDEENPPETPASLDIAAGTFTGLFTVTDTDIVETVKNEETGEDEETVKARGAIITVSGGTFRFDTVKDYLAENRALAESESGSACWYTVE